MRGHVFVFYGHGNRVNPNSHCERSEAIAVMVLEGKSVLLNIPLKTVKAIASSA